MRETLSGIVAADEDVPIYTFFGYKAFGPQTIRQAIEATPAGGDLVLEINSPGGSVLAGSEMYSVLRSNSHIHTRAEIQSLAASAASYLCLGCSEVWISPVAQMMLHLPATSTDGDRGEHLQSIKMLDSTREAILNAYELKARDKADRAEFRRMMSATTWLTAQEAVAIGLADGILYQDQSAAVPQNIMAAAGAGIRALSSSSGVPDIAALRAEYHKTHCPLVHPLPEENHINPTGEEPDHVSDDWSRKARLAIENNRFLLGGI